MDYDEKNSVILLLFVVFKECFSKNFHRGLFCPLFFIILKVDCITVIMVINSFSLPLSPVKNKLFMQRLPLIGLFFRIVYFRMPILLIHFLLLFQCLQLGLGSKMDRVEALLLLFSNSIGENC